MFNFSHSVVQRFQTDATHIVLEDSMAEGLAGPLAHTSSSAAVCLCHHSDG